MFRRGKPLETTKTNYHRTFRYYFYLGPGSLFYLFNRSQIDRRYFLAAIGFRGNADRIIIDAGRNGSKHEPAEEKIASLNHGWLFVDGFFHDRLFLVAGGTCDLASLVSRLFVLDFACELCDFALGAQKWIASSARDQALDGRSRFFKRS